MKTEPPVEVKNETKKKKKFEQNDKKSEAEAETEKKEEGQKSAIKDTDEYELVGHTGPVFAVSISIDDKHLLSGSYDNTIRRWSLQAKAPLTIYYGHSFPVWDVKFSPLGSYFASCSADRTAKLWILKN